MDILFQCGKFSPDEDSKQKYDGVNRLKVCRYEYWLTYLNVS